MSDASPCAGVAAPLHEYPTVLAAHPVTDASWTHEPGVAIAALQQYAVWPLLPAAPWPQASEGSASVGMAPPEHEYPVEGDAHGTFASTAHVLVVPPGVALVSQQ